MRFGQLEIVENPLVEPDSLVVINLKSIPPLVLPPGQTESTIEQRIDHLIKHGGIVYVHNIEKFKEQAGL